MAIGLLGKKLGMTHVYDDHGRRVAVTAIEAGPCTIVDIKTNDRDGYQALQVGFGDIKVSRINKPSAGIFKKAGVQNFKYLREFRIDDLAAYAVGQQLNVEIFQQNELVDVTGTSIGKGFQGGMKRWGWSGGPETHGSNSHRAPGSSGAGTTPGRVLKGHHAPGQMGNQRKTTQNMRIMRLDAENNLMLIMGAVPGAEEGLLIIRKSVKKPGFIKLSALDVSDTLDEAAAAKKAARGKKK